MAEFQIEREESGKGGRYVTRLEGAEAEMTWTAAESLDIIDHTYVPPELRGRSVGEALVARAVEDVQLRGGAVPAQFRLAGRAGALTAPRHVRWRSVKGGPGRPPARRIPNTPRRSVIPGSFHMPCRPAARSCLAGWPR